jgi:Ca2+-binding RTX toxin-like protein
MSNEITRFDQGFETDTAGWIGNGGTVERVASGDNGISSLDGTHHAVVEGGAFTRFANYSTEFGGGYTTRVAIYLDVNWADGQGFDYSVAANGQDGVHERDFIFHVTKDTSTGELMVGASNNTNFVPREDLENVGGAAISATGWYIFEHTFRDNGDGTLAVDMIVYEADGETVVFTDTKNESADLLDTLVGGNRYGWFTANNIPGGLAIDQVELKLAQGLGTAGVDTIVGSDADETFFASASNDTIDGAGGSDTYSFAPNATTGGYADLQSGVAFSGQTGLDTISNIENLAGTSGNDGLFGNGEDNTFFASAGTDTVDGRGAGADSDTFDASSYGTDVSINLSTGTASLGDGTTSLAGIENATGGEGDDQLTGNAGDNVLVGNGGEDTFVGNGGSDTIEGGAGLDTVEYGALSAADFELTAEGWSVEHGTGTDTLEGVEVVEASSGKFLLVGNGGYATIQEAIDAAVTGDTIMIAAGTYTGDLTITDKAIALVGVGAVTIEGQISVSDDMVGDETLSLTNLSIDATGKQYGVTVRASSDDIPGVNGGALVLDGVHIEGARAQGLFYAHQNNGSNPTNPNTIGTIEIINSSFENNGYIHSGARGHGHVNLFGFNGDLTLDGVTLTGPATMGTDSVFGTTANGATVNPHKAFTVTGIRTGTSGVGGFEDGGDLTIKDVTVTGFYASDAVSFYHIESFNSIELDNFVVDARAPWGLVNFDSVGGEIDMSGFSGTQIDGVSPIVTTLQGLASNDTLTGSDGTDVLLGRGGDDTLTGGEGNDVLVGGEGFDEAIVSGTDLDIDMFANVADANFKDAGNQPGWSLTTGGADGTDTLIGVEAVVDGDGDRILLVGSGGGYASIAEALLDAADGDTILVAAGHVEPGPITVTTANNGVTLVSVDGSAVINGAGVSQGSAVRIEAGVEGFTLGADGHGFEINAGSGDLAAVYVVGDNANITVEGNDVSGASGHAILTGGGVENSAIRGNELDSDGPAAVVYVNGAASLGNTSSNVEISGNQITGGANAGLLVGTEASDSLISGNTFSGEASYAQLEVFGTGATIEDNTFSADSDTAIIDAGDAANDDVLVDAQTSFSPGAVWVEFAGGEGDVIYTSIQAAIDAAPVGATIHIGAGVFEENLVINKEVHLVGEPGAVLQGYMVDLVGAHGGLDGYFEATHSGYTASIGIDLQGAADGSSITGLTIQGFSKGIDLGSVSGVTIEDNIFVNNVTGINKDANDVVETIAINGNDFSHGIHGVTIHGDGTGLFDGVTIDDNSFSAMSEKGMYFEQLSNANLTGNSFDDVGNYGRVAPPFGPAGQNGDYGQAIDINLKALNYENVTFTDTEITNSGHSDENGTAPVSNFGAAIGIKIRDDNSGASFTGSVVFDGLVIDGTSTGVRVGEPGKNNDGPNVELIDVTIDNASVTDVDNATDPVNGGTTVVEFSATQEDLDAGASQADVDVVGNDLDNDVITGSGDDTFQGGAGTDTFNGGDGIDTAVFADVSAIAEVGGNWQVTSLADGQDTLTDVEIVEGGGPRTLLVGAGGFDSIAAALAEANDGDTIMLAAGTYTEDVTISEGVTIIGSDGGDSVVTGAWTILSSEQVHIDGLTFRDDKPVVLSIADNFVALKVLTHSAAGHIIENSTFERVPSSYPVPFNPTAFAGSNNQQTHRAIELASVGAGSTISILNNTFTGTNDYTYAGDSWRSGIYSNGGLGTTLIDGNTFENVRSAINADNFTTTVTITDNNFLVAGSAISIGGAGANGSDLSTISANQFGAVDTEFNFQGVPNGVVFDANAAIDGPVGDSGVVIYGSSAGGDTITGTDYADTVIGGGGNDSIDTGEGADGISGGAGIDTINAGDGADTIVGGADADIMDGGDGDDLFLLNSSSEFATGEVINGGDGFDTIVWDAQSYDVLFLSDDVTGIERVEMLGSSDSLLGVLHVENSLEIMGNSGDNTIAGTFFADTIDGGAGIDTVEYYMGETVTNVDGVWTVGGDELTNVEIVNVEGARTLLVGDGGFETIQEALAAATDGDTILISDGVYTGELSINLNDITLKAIGDVTLLGDGNPATSDKAITVSGDNFRVEGIKIDNYYTGVELANGADGVDIIDVDISNAAVAVRKGTAAVVSDVTFEGGSISDSEQGIVIYKAGGADVGHLNGLTVKDVTFTDIAQKGIYVETLTGNNSFTGLDFTNVGHVGQAGTNKFGAGIDVNLKAGDYSGTVLEIDDFTFVNVGTSEGGGSPDPTGAAITIKGRDDAPSYSGTPAVTNGMVVTISNGTINGTSTGIRQGEPGKPDSASNVTGPSVTVLNVSILGAAISEIDNVSKSEMIVNAGTADGIDDVYEAGTDDTATGSITFIGNADDNTFTGGLGDDSFSGDAGADNLSGGEGDDTFVYTSMAEVLDDTLDGGAGFDTLAFDTAVDTDIVLGADTFGMEQVTIGGAAVNLDASAVTTGLSLVGTEQANTLVGTSGNDVISALDGNDTIVFGTGQGDDALDGGDGEDTLTVSTVAALGSATVDVSTTVDGLLVQLGDTATGSVLAENVEELVITLGSEDENEINLVGDLAAAGINLITVVGGDTRTALHAELLTSETVLDVTFGAGDDTFYGGGAGDDDLVGGLGFDTLNYASATSGVIVNLEASSAKGLSIGNDFVTGFEAVRGSALYDVIRGNTLANTFYATAGADYIDGRGGLDMFDARLLLEDMEIDLAVGFAFNSEIGLTNLISIEQAVGGRGDDIMYGTSGNNFLDGYVGEDYMEGGLGDDTYVINTTADQIVEFANEGIDTVLSSTNYTLGAHLENVTLTGTLNRFATGNSLDNVLIGNSGNNVLNGAAGADTMTGGDGNDTYHVNTYKDKVIEEVDGGIDTVISNTNYTLTDNVENLTLNGTYDRSGTGNALNNVIKGNAFNNDLNGMAGVDNLWGQGGSDTFIFSDATHSGVGSGNRDIIRDFGSDDLIDVSQIAEFTLLAQNDAFTAGGDAELRWVQSGGNTIVSADLNGDGVADFDIQITGLVGLTSDDFLL